MWPFTNNEDLTENSDSVSLTDVPIEMNRAKRPFQAEPATLGILQLWVDQQARIDAKQKTDDAISIRRLGHLSGESQIHRRISEERRSYKESATGENGVQYALTQDKIVRGTKGRSIERLEELIQAQREVLSEAEEERKLAAAVLIGAQPDSWQRNFVGPVPSPTEQWWKRISLGTVFSIILWLGEVSATVPVAWYLFGRGGWWSIPILVGVVVLVALVLLLAPSRIGEEIRGPAFPSGPRRYITTTVTTVLLGLLWLAGVIAISLLRVYVTLTVEERLTKFKTPSAIWETVTTSPEALLFFAFFLAAGFLITLIYLRKNPYQSYAREASDKIRNLNQQLSALISEQDLSMAELRVAEEEAQATRESYELRQETLTDWEEALVEQYRRIYAQEAGDPDISDALQLASE